MLYSENSNGLFIISRIRTTLIHLRNHNRKAYIRISQSQLRTVKNVQL